MKPRNVQNVKCIKNVEYNIILQRKSFALFVLVELHSQCYYLFQRKSFALFVLVELHSQCYYLFLVVRNNNYAKRTLSIKIFLLLLEHLTHLQFLLHQYLRISIIHFLVEHFLPAPSFLNIKGTILNQIQKCVVMSSPGLEFLLFYFSNKAANFNLRTNNANITVLHPTLRYNYRHNFTIDL